MRAPIKGKGAFEARQGRAHRFTRRFALGALARHQLRHHFGIRLRFELGAVGDQITLQFGEILDDAVMNDDHIADHVWMRIGFGWSAMRRPARMADAR